MPSLRKYSSLADIFMTTIYKLGHFIIIICIFISCKNHEIIHDPNKIFDTPKLSDSLSFYYPDLLNRKSTGHSMFDNYEQNWYSSTLYSLKEPILKNKTDDETLYRFLWLRSFHEPVCYTLKEFNKEYFLCTKTLDRCPAWFPHMEGRFENGKKIIDTIQRADRKANITFIEIIKLKSDEWIKFQKLIAKSNFWNLQSIDTLDMSADGSEWLFEGYMEKQYHFVQRQNAKELRIIGEYLISLSNLTIPEDFKY